MQGLDTLCLSHRVTLAACVLCAPGTVLSPFHASSHLILTAILSCRWVRNLSPREVEPLAPSHSAGEAGTGPPVPCPQSPPTTCSSMLGGEAGFQSQFHHGQAV